MRITFHSTAVLHYAYDITLLCFLTPLNCHPPQNYRAPVCSHTALSGNPKCTSFPECQKCMSPKPSFPPQNNGTNELETNRFNVYLVMGVLAQFSNKLFKRWGKALLMGIKEAHRCRNIRLSLEAQINVPPVRAGKTPTFAPPGSTPVLPSDPILVIPSVPSSPVLSAKSSPGAFSFASPTRIRRVSVSRSPVLARRAVSREREGGGGLGSGLGSSRSPLRARGGKSVGRGKRRLGMAVELAAGAAAAEKEEEERFPDCSSHDAEKGSVGSGHGDGERRDSKLDSGSTSRRRSLPLSAVWRRSKGGRNDAVLDRRRHTLGSEVSALRGSPVNDSSMASIAFLNGQMPSGPKDSIGEKGTHDCDNRKRETGCLEENGVVMPPSSSTVSRGISLRLGIRRTRRGGGAAVEKAGTPVALTPFSVEQGFRSSGSESGNDLLLPLPPSRAAASKKGDSTRGTGAETAASRYPKRPVPTGGSDNLRRSSIHRHGRGWGSASLVFPLVCGMVAMVVSVLVVAYGRRRWCLGVSC